MNLMKMMKQAASMKGEMKKIQKELAGKTVEGVSRGVRVVARCDMSIDSIKISPDMINSSDIDQLENSVVSAVNNALGAAKKEAGREMSKLTGGLGLGDMFS